MRFPLAVQNGKRSSGFGMRGSCTLSCMRKTYTTDLSDEEWAYLKIRLPASNLPSRLRAHSLRDIFDAIFYPYQLTSRWLCASES